MTKRHQKTRVEPVSKKEKAAIVDATSVKHGPNMKPGETINVEVERTDTHGFASIALESSDGSFKVVLEAAVLADDEHPDEISPAGRMDVALDFVDAMLQQFLADGREGRYHEDWTLYEFEDTVVRFRGTIRRPDLEALADAWLAAEGDPESDA